MKFLLYSQSGEGCQALKKIELEGNKVCAYIKDPVYKRVFDGLLPKTTRPEDFLDKDTIIIFDMSGNGFVADSFRRRGHYVFGGSSFADDLECNREFGFEMMSRCGIQIPGYKEFKNFKSGIEYVRSSNKRLVFKPSGTMPAKLTYVSKNTQELLRYLEFVDHHFGKEIDSFILQDFIEGVVVSSEYWCDGKKFVDPPNHTVEIKKSMNDDLGPSTGCAGNITWPCDSKIVQNGIKLAEKFCVEHKFIGNIDLNVVANESGIYGLEWTPRWGYDATPTLLTLLEQDLGQTFADFAKGNGSLKVKDNYAGGVRLSVTPYPTDIKDQSTPSGAVAPDETTGLPIQNYEEFCEDIYFYEVMTCEDGLCHSSGSGVIACALGIGDTPKASMEKPYQILKEISLPDKQYRTDLIEVLPKMIEEMEQYAE